MNHQSQFVLISETFLKMYNTIFRRLHSFILSNENTEWTKRTHHQVPFVDEELTDFQVRKLSEKLTQFTHMPCLLQVPKCFVPNQIFIYILWQSQTFCARQKDDLHSVKLVFVLAQKFLKRYYLKAVNFLGWLKKFGSAQNILGPVKGQSIILH